MSGFCSEVQIWYDPLKQASTPTSSLWRAVLHSCQAQHNTTAQPEGAKRPERSVEPVRDEPEDAGSADLLTPTVGRFVVAADREQNP